MLLGKGVTQAQIRRGVKQHVKRLYEYEEASTLFRRVCEQMIVRLQEEDELEQLAKKLPKKDRKNMS